MMGVPKFESVEGTSEPETLLFGDTPSGRSLGKGEITRVTTENELSARLGKDLSELGLAVYDLRQDGIYGTEIEPGKFLFLNTGPGAVSETITCGGKSVVQRVDGGTITEVQIK